MNQCPPSPWVFHKDHLNYFRKFPELIVNQCLSAVSTTLAIKCSAVSMTRLVNLLAVSLTPAINLCHWFSLIGGAPVLLKPAINFSLVSLTPLKNDRRRQRHLFCTATCGIFYQTPTGYTAQRKTRRKRNMGCYELLSTSCHPPPLPTPRICRTTCNHVIRISWQRETHPPHPPPWGL